MPLDAGALGALAMFTFAAPKNGWVPAGMTSWSVIDAQSLSVPTVPTWMPSDSCHAICVPSGANDV